MIAEVLSRGIENCRTTEELCQYFGFKNSRELQFAVAAERKKGVPILSSCGRYNGYFLAKDQEELKKFIKSMDNRRKEINEATQAARIALEQW